MLLCVALLAAAAPLNFGGKDASAAGKTLYVAGGGSDSNDNSQTHPFRQIRRALATAAPGDTNLVPAEYRRRFGQPSKSGDR